MQTWSSTGKVTDCAIPSATNGPDSAEVTGQALSRRARFGPALDKDGHPAASYFVGTVTWKFS